VIKSIGQVDFCHIGGALSRVGIADAKEEAYEGASKLHRLVGAEADGLIVDSPKRVVGNQSGLAITLGNDSQGGETQVVHCLDEAVGHYGPEAFVDKFQHFLAKELKVVVTRLVGAPFEAFLAERRAPRWCGHAHGHAVASEALQQSDSRMARVWKRRM
jgi:hypothetical protein